MLTMVMDHVRFVWPGLMGLFVPGRLAFPLFALVMALNVYRQREGAPLSSTNLRYLALLIAASAVSEVPYRLAFGPSAVTLNILPTLVLGLLVGWGVTYRTWTIRCVALCALAVGLIAHDHLNYGFLGVLLPAALLIAIRHPCWTTALPSGLCFLMSSGAGRFEAFFAFDQFSILVMTVAAAAPIFGLWLSRQDIKFPVSCVTRWGYAFYPGHLFLLALISVFTGANA